MAQAFQVKDQDVALSNVATVERWYAAQAAYDRDALYALMAPDVVFHEADGLPMEGTYAGAEANVDGLMPVVAPHFAEFAIDREGLLDAGDHVVSFGRYRGRAAATGAPLDAPFVHIWTVKDGRVTRMRQYTNTLAFWNAFGQADALKLRDAAQPHRSA